jgi:ribonuclease E
VGRSKADLTRDFKYLSRLWEDIKKRAQKPKAPALIYEEMELATRAVRDYLSADVAEIWIDDKDTEQKIQQFMKLAFPRSTTPVRLHTEPNSTLWERFRLDKQIEAIYSREVVLPSGGRLVIDPTEALTAIDINSGKIAGERNFHKMVVKTNLEATVEIARQLKLRDIGGQVVIDYIEMKNPKDCREVEKTMRQALKSDRARTVVGRLSEFGLLELVRQRMGSSALAVTTEPCPCCSGTGVRRNMEWQALQALKTIFRLLRQPNCPNPMVYECEEELCLYLLNHKREKLNELERRFNTGIEIEIEIEYVD